MTTTKRFSRPLATLILTLLPLTAIQAELANPDSVRQLMTSSGAIDMSSQMLTQMIPTLKRMLPDAPEHFWRDVEQEINTNEMVELLIPVYQKHLSEEEIQAIIDFHNTPAGKKLIKVQPQIMQESITIGQQWGQNIARKVITKYQSQHEQ